MNLEAITSRETWLVLQGIKKNYLLTASDERVDYELADVPGVQPEVQRKILRKLTNVGALKTIRKGYFGPATFYSESTDPDTMGKPRFFLFELVSGQFEKTFNEYAKINGVDVQTVDPTSIGRPSFDEKTLRLTYGDKSFTLEPKGSNQAVLCAAVFDVPFGEWVKETDVVSNFFRGVEKERSFYDAVRLLNEKILEQLGIEKMLEYKASRARIRKELFI